MLGLAGLLALVIMVLRTWVEEGNPQISEEGKNPQISQMTQMEEGEIYPQMGQMGQISEEGKNPQISQISQIEEGTAQAGTGQASTAGLPLDTAHWPLDTDHWTLDTGHSSLPTRHSFDIDALAAVEVPVDADWGTRAMPFVLLLILTGVLLTLGPEFVYLRDNFGVRLNTCLLYTSPSPRD